MITKSSAFWKVVDQLKVLPDGDPIDEALLFFAWKHLVQKDNTQKIPKLEDVIERRSTLEEAYSGVSQYLGLNYHAYNFSTVWQYVSADNAIKICQAVNEFEEIDKYELLRTCLELKSSSRKYLDLHIFENELIEFLVNLVDAESGIVFAPYDRSLQVSIHCAARGFKVIYSHASPGAFTEAARIIAGLVDENLDAINDLEYMFGSAELAERTEKYSRMILIPPFGGGYSTDRKLVNSEVKLIENAIARCTGRLVVLVPQGVLFRGGESSDLRRDLVSHGLLDAVIQLPTPLLRGTNLALAVLMVKKDRNERNQNAVFIDAGGNKYSEDMGRGNPVVLRETQQLIDVALRKTNVDSVSSQLVDYCEIIDNSSELSVSKYVIGKASAILNSMSVFIRLDEVAFLIRGQLLKEEKTEDAQTKRFFEVGVRDISEDGVIQRPEKSVTLSKDMILRAEKQKLLPGDILFVTKGSVGKVGMVGSDCGDNWVASQSFQIIRVADYSGRITEIYLYMFLSSELVQKYFEEHVTGTTIPILKTGDIRGLPIPIPDVEERKKIEEEYSSIRVRWEKIHLLKDEILEIKSARWNMAQL